MEEYMLAVLDVWVGIIGSLLFYFCYFYIYYSLLSMAPLKNRNSSGFAAVFFYHSDPLNFLLNLMIF